MVGMIGYAVRCAPVLLLLVFSACTATIGVLTPRPAISLAPSSQRLALALAPQVPDAFDLGFSGGGTVRFGGLRTSIGNGFAAGIGRYYAPAGGGNADLILYFEMVAVEFVPEGSGHLVLRYAARLDDRAGRTLGRSFGTLHTSHTAFYDVALEEALGRMFEKIAADCFVPLTIAR
jgi:hypothetical protein